MGAPRWASAARAAAGAALPTIGAVLGGPLGGVVGAMVAKQLGTEPTPEAVTHALANDPDAYVKLKEIEAQLAIDANATDVQLATIETADRQSARANRGDDRMRMVLALFLIPAPLIVAAVLVAAIVLLNAADVPASVQNVVSIVLGYLIGEAKSASSFYFGTSVGSKRRAEQISQMVSK